MRKSLLAVAAIAVGTQSALAGGYVEPRVEPQIAPEVIVEDTSSSSAGIIVPLLLLVLIGAAIANRGSGMMDSDARIKTDVVRVGATTEGLPLYHFRYMGDARVWEGVMAQDVLGVRPDAVRVGPYGTYQVDYAALGIEMRQVR